MAEQKVFTLSIRVLILDEKIIHSGMCHLNLALSTYQLYEYPIGWTAVKKDYQTLKYELEITLAKKLKKVQNVVDCIQ